MACDTTLHTILKANIRNFIRGNVRVNDDILTGGIMISQIMKKKKVNYRYSLSYLS